MKIYADNAATTKLSSKAYEAMLPYLLEEYGNPSQPYSLSRKPKNALKKARESIAKCIGAYPDEIYFTSGGTESDNWVINSVGLFNQRQGTIITSAIEHHAILRSCNAIEKLGNPVVYMAPTESGEITPKILKNHITNDTNFVSVMYVNNEIGTVQPIEELCCIAHENGALFHTDAVQAVGHIDIDVHKLGVDFLSASAHKFNGPRGIGFLYIKNGVDLFPYLCGGGQENGMRAGTENVAAIVGMAVALKENTDQIVDNIDYVSSLEHILLNNLNSTEQVFKRNGINQMPGIISLSFPGLNGEAILHRMDLKGIYISTGSACDSKETQISHVLKAIQLEEDLAKGTVRISLSRHNTPEEVLIISQEVNQIISQNV